MATVHTRSTQEDNTTASAEVTRKDEIARTQEEQAKVDWDYENMTTNFANVVNIQSSPEQLDICFGTNHTWTLTDERRVRVELTNRIIMSPLAAKRMRDALDKVLKEHELRYGTLTIG